MKHSFILKTALSLFAATIVIQTPEIKGYESYLYQSFNVTSDAIDSINKIKEDKNHLHKVSKVYCVGKNTITSKTKIHFSTYRKKPEIIEEIFHVNTTAINAKSIHFVYNKSDKNHITQTIKGSKENTKIALNKNKKFIKSA